MNTKLDCMKEFKGMNVCSKMEYSTKTVKQLQSIARERGMVGYSGLRKAELVAFVSSRLMQSDQTGLESNLLDAPIPDIKVPTLTPGKYTPPSNTWTSSFSNVLKEVKHKVRSKLNSFANWLVNFVTPPERKPVNEKLQALRSKISSIFSKINKPEYKIQETASAIRGFTKQYTI